jgi:hypothetical protein
MDKIKKILALLAVAALIICAILTLIFALMDYTAAWKASAWCMVVLPCFFYAMLLVYKLLNGRGK